MYNMVMVNKKIKGSDDYVTVEYSGIRHEFYESAVKELNEARRMNPYFFRRILDYGRSIGICHTVMTDIQHLRNV